MQEELLDEQGRVLADSPALAAKLGVSTNQIYMWNQRWAGNGFPEPTHHRAHGVRANAAPRNKYLWVLDQVVEWHRNYVPAKGGAGSHRRKSEPLP